MFGVINTESGSVFANNLLRPTITGVVVPVISIALATLVSTTVNVLRQRQVDLRAYVNKEACELDYFVGQWLVCTVLDNMPEEEQGLWHCYVDMSSN